MIKLLLYGFLFYVLYKLVFNFFIPVYKATKQVKTGFKEMNERMGQQNYSDSPDKTEKNKTGEYIDYEEVKD